MKIRLVSSLLLIVAGLILTATMFVETNKDRDFLERRTELSIRKIGHDLLLHGKDSASRVMPVKKVGSNSFQLEFENKFSFMPDSLVNIVHRSLASSNLPLSYLVQVFDCATSEMVYGFEVWSPFSKVESCLGRVQPRGCYSIQITFTEPIQSAGSRSAYYYGVLGIVGIALLTLVWPKSQTTVLTKQDSLPNNTTTIGTLEFDQASGFLKQGEKKIPLSNKESKLLRILASNTNQLVDRTHLQNEIWESEGVITGRSLDMFISKLRKKLSNDSTIKIVNVHGRGYKLEVR